MITIKKLVKLYYNKGNVCVDGLRGAGKDILTANIINQRGQPYISNLDYECNNKNAVYNELDFNKLDIKNDFNNFISGDINYYDYPYAEKVDIYISDCNLYFPCQYNNELDKKYKNLPNFFALSRQLGLCNIHLNTQSINRIWNKLHEQSDTYLKANWCRVLFKNIVIQRITIYDKMQSCIDRVEPYIPIKIPIFASKEMKASLRMKNEEMLRNFREEKGFVKSFILVYRNNTNYDTRFFKKLLLGGKKCD